METGLQHILPDLQNLNALFFVTNVDGLLDDDKNLVTHLDLKRAKEILPTIGPGMEKKILASTEAIEMGVDRALITNGKKENPISSAPLLFRCTCDSP